MAKKNLTQKELDNRNEIIEEMNKMVGSEKIEKWLKDPDKLSVLNALAAATTR